MRNVLTPTPKVSIGHAIAQSGLMTACMDNSDGLCPSLAQLAATNDVQLSINLDSVAFSKEFLHVARRLDVEEVRLARGWGDWSLVGTVKPSNMMRLLALGHEHGCPVHMIGEVRPGHGVRLTHGTRSGEMWVLDSQRFTAESWFTRGIDLYIEELLHGPLWAE